MRVANGTFNSDILLRIPMPGKKGGALPWGGNAPRGCTAFMEIGRVPVGVLNFVGGNRPEGEISSNTCENTKHSRTSGEIGIEGNLRFRPIKGRRSRGGESSKEKGKALAKKKKKKAHPHDLGKKEGGKKK